MSGGDLMTDLSNRKPVYVASAGPSSYATGGFNIEISDLAKVDIAYVANVTGGYTGEIAEINGNVVKVKVYSSAGTEVSAGTDLSGVTVKIMAYSL